MKCVICSHPKRIEIDRAIINSKNLSKVAKTFDVGYTSVFNHAKDHVTRQLATAMEKKESDEGMDLLQRIDQIIRRAEKIFKRNYDTGKDLIALKALDSQKSTIELLAKISYSLHQAKITELEMTRQEIGEQQQQENMVIVEQGISRLNENEKALLFAIQMKMMGASNQNVIPETIKSSKDLLTAITNHLPLNNLNATDVEFEQFDNELMDYRPNGSNTLLRRNKPPKRSKLAYDNEEYNDLSLEDLKYKAIPPTQIPGGDIPWSDNPINPNYCKRSEKQSQKDIEQNRNYKEMSKFNSSLDK